MNKLSDKLVRDGIYMISSYHFLLSVVAFIAAAGILVYAVIPGADQVGAPQGVFMPMVGVVIGVVLAVAYGIVGFGLISLKNSARMGAIFLALFGVVGGLLILIGALIGTAKPLVPDWLTIGGIAFIGLCSYALTTLIDMAALLFLLSGRVRAPFYGEAWEPELEEEPEPVRPAAYRRRRIEPEYAPDADEDETPAAALRK